MKNLYAILGHPVSHSQSPAFHNAVFRSLGLDEYSYDYCDTVPEDLEALLQDFRGGKYAGFSVTIPHKQAVVPFCDVLSEKAKKVGSVNTLVSVSDAELSNFRMIEFSKGIKHDRIIVGDNTDYLGFEKSLEEQGVFADRDGGERERKKVLVMGSGGAARAVVAVLVDHGFDVVVATRNVEKAGNEWKAWKDGEGLKIVGYDELHPNDDWKVIVNTTPVGMTNDQLSISNSTNLLLEDEKWYRADRVYVDIVYTPKMTPFLLRAQEVGGNIVTGDRMFFWQAVEQSKLFTGREDIPMEVFEEAFALLQS